MKKWFSNNMLYIFGSIIGAIGGYIYWLNIGCTSGTCAITSSPINRTLYGALMGALFLGLFKKEKSSKNEL